MKRDKKGRFVKGFHPKTEFKKGHHSKTQIKKGQHISPETEFKRGHKNSKAVKEKASLGVKRKWRNSKFRKKMKIARDKQYGENHSNWKGDKAKKEALHIWVRNHKPKPKPKFCEFCYKRKSYDLANIKNHKYTRNPDDYKWACRSCHLKFDRSLVK
jgi:hypothetical protein